MRKGLDEFGLDHVYANRQGFFNPHAFEVTWQGHLGLWQSRERTDHRTLAVTKLVLLSTKWQYFWNSLEPICSELRSYQNASRLVGSLSQDLGELVASGEIFNLKGIGKGLGTAISQAVGEGNGQKTGRICTLILLKG